MPRIHGGPPQAVTRFSTVAEVAKALRVSKMTVYRLIDDQEIPAFKVGHSIRIPTASVWEYLETTRVGGASVTQIPRVESLPAVDVS